MLLFREYPNMPNHWDQSAVKKATLPSMKAMIGPIGYSFILRTESGHFSTIYGF